MDSYIVRIYRRDAKDPYKAAGVAEHAERNGERAIYDLKELIDILALHEPIRNIQKSKRARNKSKKTT